jgi:hypothetical protein
MGQGIAAVIPIWMEIERRDLRNDSIREKHPEGFLDCFVKVEDKSGRDRNLWKINMELLLANYTDFVNECYGMIGETLISMMKRHSWIDFLKKTIKDFHMCKMGNSSHALVVSVCRAFFFIEEAIRLFWRNIRPLYILRRFCVMQ